jgi:branched-chain amino acid transport system ATP-binding protein
VTFLFVEHDMEVVMNHSDRVIVMAEGKVIADGEPHEVRSDQAVIDAYLGGQKADAEEIAEIIGEEAPPADEATETEETSS